MLDGGPTLVPRQDLGLLPEPEFQQVHPSFPLGVCDVPRCGVCEHGTSLRNGDLGPFVDWIRHGILFFCWGAGITVCCKQSSYKNAFAWCLFSYITN
ncbi:hypothetical protein DPMN_122048 [Dreissena polymorpha]|uniref:Uncharacterized protein n=1 Tax=Dreissena polymorpha TaxID=45954 RepID=A0A9D4GNX6_DREPO|nr:hypothetical protein DPMN_122048 [Dreissena polymorpha]